MFTYIDEQEATAPPPQTPRSAKFRLSGFEIYIVLLISFGFLIMIRQWWTWWEFRNEPFSQPLDCSDLGQLVLYLFYCYLFVKPIRQNRRLFTNGIAVCATVKFVGKIPESFSKSTRDVVRWQYIVDGVEHAGLSPREELPNSVLGDVFWVLYQKKNPNFVRRWESFDIDGNLVHSGDKNADVKARYSRAFVVCLAYFLCVLFQMCLTEST